MRNIAGTRVHSAHKLLQDKQISEDDERRANTQIDDLSKQYTETASLDNRQGQGAREVMEV